jgi:hypothetical protein
VRRKTAAALIPGRIILQFPAVDFSGADDAQLVFPRSQNDLDDLFTKKGQPPCDVHHGTPAGARVVQMHGSAGRPGAREKSFKPGVVKRRGRDGPFQKQFWSGS